MLQKLINFVGYLLNAVSSFTETPQKIIYCITVCHDEQDCYKHVPYSPLTLCILGNFSYSSCRLPTFFKKFFSGTLSECQTVWIQIRTDIMSVLIWVQLFAKIISRQQKSPLTRKKLKALISEHRALFWLWFKHQLFYLHASTVALIRYDMDSSCR